MYKLSLTYALAALLVSAATSNAQEFQIVVPPGLESVDGNETGLAPEEPGRIQYLYDASHFASLSGPHLILFSVANSTE